MKRISTFVALLVLLCGVCQGRHSQRYRVHYNPHAFNYHSNGLVGGGVRYSMHAFNYHNSGLIQEYQIGRSRPAGPCYILCDTPATTRSSRCTPRRTSNRRFAISNEKLREKERQDGVNVIRQYLAEQGFRNIRLRHQLSIENETIGAVLVASDSNLVITYRNDKAIAALSEETGYKKRAFERFERQLAETSTVMLARGARIHAVEASGRDQVLVAMQNCMELTPETQTATPVTMVAKN